MQKLVDPLLRRRQHRRWRVASRPWRNRWRRSRGTLDHPAHLAHRSGTVPSFFSCKKRTIFVSFAVQLPWRIVHIGALITFWSSLVAVDDKPLQVNWDHFSLLRIAALHTNASQRSIVFRRFITNRYKVWNNVHWNVQLDRLHFDAVDIDGYFILQDLNSNFVPLSIKKMADSVKLLKAHKSEA